MSTDDVKVVVLDGTVFGLVNNVVFRSLAAKGRLRTSERSDLIFNME